MSEPQPLPAGTPAGWHTDPVDSTRYRYWDGSAWTAQTSAEGGDVRTFTVEDYLRALGVEVKKIRGATNLIAFVAFVQLLLIALWLFGALTVAFEQDF